MRSALIVVAAALGLVDAAGNMLLPYGAVGKRQAFDPDEGTGTGANCVEAFGEGYIECRPRSDTQPFFCINPGLGETCCENSWGCPADSFCLVQDLCCPDGLDPATCAEQNNVTLPDNFSATSSATASEQPSSTGAPASFTATPSESSSGASSATASSTSKGPVVTAGARHEKAGAAAAVLGFAAALVL